MSEVIALNVSTARRLVAVAYLDVAGYSTAMSADEVATLGRLTRLRTQAIEPRVQYWRGRIANRAGDGLLIEFGSALDAANWAIELQRYLEGSGAAESGGLKVRIGLHLTDVIDYDGADLMGDGVNIAARLQQMSVPGGVIASQSLVDAVNGKIAASFVDIGPRRLKHIARPVHTYRLENRPQSKPRRWPHRATAIAVGGAALVAMAAQTLKPGETAPAQAERLTAQAESLKCTEAVCVGVQLEKRRLLEQAIAVDPSLARAYAADAATYTNMIGFGASSDKEGDLRTAARLTTQAVALAPDQAFSFGARAAVLRQSPDKIELALADYVRAIQLDPSLTWARANVGYMLILLGRAEEAPHYLDAALAEAPNHSYAPYWLAQRGLADLLLDRDGHGASYFRRAIDAEPSTPKHWQNRLENTIALAVAEALNGDIEDARRIVAQTSASHPTLSLANVPWNCTCSTNPRFLADITKLRRGAALAGVPVFASDTVTQN